MTDQDLEAIRERNEYRKRYLDIPSSGKIDIDALLAEVERLREMVRRLEIEISYWVGKVADSDGMTHSPRPPAPG